MFAENLPDFESIKSGVKDFKNNDLKNKEGAFFKRGYNTYEINFELIDPDVNKKSSTYCEEELDLISDCTPRHVHSEYPCSFIPLGTKLRTSTPYLYKGITGNKYIGMEYEIIGHKLSVIYFQPYDTWFFLHYLKFLRFICVYEE